MRPPVRLVVVLRLCRILVVIRVDFWLLFEQGCEIEVFLVDVGERAQLESVGEAGLLFEEVGFWFHDFLGVGGGCGCLGRLEELGFFCWFFLGFGVVMLGGLSFYGDFASCFWLQ